MAIRNLGHRGFSGKYPENTRLAFIKAIEEGHVDGFESDVRLSLDGEPVIIHDGDLSRTTDGSGPVGNKRFTELRELDNGVWKGREFAGQHILHLDELLELTAKFQVFLNLEIKNGENFYKNIEEKCIKRINALGVGKQVLISSFNHMSVQRCMEIDGSIKTGFLFENPFIDMDRYAQQYHADAIHPRFSCLYYSPDLTARAHKNGIAVNTWTVNREEDIRYCIKLGVDSIISNYPDRTALLLKEPVYG